MPGFRRVFNTFPGFSTLSNIESVNIIDIPPPVTPLGAGAGVVGIVGEFEKGTFNSPKRVFGGTDLTNTFGGFGFTKDGVPFSGPTSRQSADSSQFWEGNGFIALRNKKFAGLVITRVDNSAGSVQISRLASRTGTLSAPFDLEPGQTLIASVDGGGAATATFDAAVATRAGSGGTFPTGFLGGETLEVSVDGGPTRVITFTASEQSAVQVVSYVNSQLAATIAAENSGEVDFSSLQRGTGASFEIVGGTGVATLGHTVGTSTGTGDVANIDAVSQAEVKAVVEADISGTRVEVDAAGLLRIAATTTPGTGTIQITGGTGLTGLGLTVDASAVSAATGTAAVTVPAGTRVRDTTASADWVTMEDLVFAADSGGPSNVKVRPWLDDDTTPTALAGDIVEILDVLDDAFSVANSADISRITGAALDAAYSTAFDSTLDVNGVPFDINIMYAARHTANIQRFGRDNALTATETGHRARKFITAPPVGTSRTDAASQVAAVRNQRLFFLHPGVTTFIPEIARLGTDGGVGFSADGVIELPADGFYASVRSLLNPEENAGQRLSDTNVGAVAALSLEDDFNPEEGGLGLTIQDYQSFKSGGIIAPRVDRVAGMVFQSDVTSVDPNTDPAIADGKRRFMGDLIIDSLFDIAINFVKKLNTPVRRRALTGQINAFLNLLKSENQPDLARIEDFDVRDDTTDEQRGLGFQLYTVQVRLFASMDSIVITTEVGTTVTIEEAA